jgi:hypothetical protein
MKRFTETAKWSDPWFRKLRPEIKNLWGWLCDNCDNAGVIDIDIELASFHIGYQYSMDTLSELGDRLIKLECGKWFLPKFIPFQYGVLSEDCKGHNPVFLSLQKHFPKGYPKGIHTPQDRTGQGQGQGQDKDKAVGVKTKPTLDEVKLVCSKTGVPESDAIWFWNKCEANGWTNGGKPIKSWPHTIAAWKAAGYLPSQKQNGKAVTQAARPVGGNF